MARRVGLLSKGKCELDRKLGPLGEVIEEVEQGGGRTYAALFWAKPPKTSG